MAKRLKTNSSRWLIAALATPATLGLFGATVAWANTVDPLANQQTTTVSPAPAGNSNLEARLAANEATILDLQNKLSNLNNQIAAVKAGKPLPAQNKPAPTKTKTPTPAQTKAPATNTTTGGSGA
jgi:hypothetical protein